MTSKHTPGHWRLKRGTEFRDGEIKEYSWVGFGTVGDETPVTAHGIPENSANAKLIAAAPELLDALKLVWRTQGQILPDGLRVAVTDAIAEAEES